MRIGWTFVFLLGACDDVPELSDLRCTPDSLSLATPSPYEVDCDLQISDVAHVETVRWSTSGAWVSGEQAPSGSRFHFALMKTDPPPLGTLTIHVEADDVRGIDGPDIEPIETSIVVVQ